MTTRFCVRFNGGPWPGDRVFYDDEEDGLWPPAERVFFVGGEYVRIGYSHLGPTDPEKDFVIRGAEYDWVPEEGFPWPSTNA